MVVKRVGRTALAMLLFALSVHAALAQEEATQEPPVQTSFSEDPVYEAFEEYRAAILAADADAALRRIDSTTVDYYAAMLDYAVNAEEQQVRALGAMDLLMVLSIRHRLSPERAQAMDAEALFKHGVANGWVGSQSVAGIVVTAIATEGTTAEVSFETNGEPSPVSFRLQKEDGRWKVDLTSVMESSSLALSQFAENQDITEAALAMLLLQRISEEPIDEEKLWRPLKQP